MEPDDIRVEIERRRKRAIDLKMREIMWTLYKSHLKYYAEKLKKDPEMIYPEIMETLLVSDANVEFHVAENTYCVIYKEGQEERESSWGSRRRDETDRYLHSRRAPLQRIHG
jgi:hypothetical protein